MQGEQTVFSTLQWRNYVAAKQKNEAAQVEQQIWTRI